MKLLVDVHGDDGALFAAWTIIRERPAVLVVYDSVIQTRRGVPGCDTFSRRYETADALQELLFDGKCVQHETFLGFEDDLTYTPEMISAAIATHVMQQLETVTDIWAPAFEEGGHEQHNIVAFACNAFEGTCNLHRYLTYTRAGGKSRVGNFADRRAKEVLPPSGEAIARKLRALACFKSQMQLDPRLGTAEWFYGNDLREYVLPPAKAGETRS